MADANRDLLFGLLALQNGLIDQGALVDAFRAWGRDRSRPLAEYLATRGDLDADQRAGVEAMVGLHLKKHGGDPARSLAAIPAGASARDSLSTIGDDHLARSLAHLATEPDFDPHRTLDPGGGADPHAQGAAGPVGRRFRVLRPHARGGLGAVSVAIDAELDREVALKEILDQHADDPVSRSRFVLEARITGGLEHPGIVPVYGLGAYADGRPYYAMRFIKGDNLKEAADRFHADEALREDPGRRSLELRKWLHRFTGVCDAIAYAHSRGVLHRDIKPGNIIVGQHGETLVVDWGLAKAVGRIDPEVDSGERALAPSSSGSSETQPGSAVGTPAYMSPEQAEGDQDRLGPRSDVYSLGATLYHLLTGRAPFDGGALEVIRAVRRGDWPPPRQVDPTIDRALEAVCLKAMAFEPADRYPSPMGLSEDIERWMADEPVSAWREPIASRARRWMRRHRTSVAGAAALLIAVAVALAIGLVAVDRERARTAVERNRAEVALADLRREKDRADRALIAETSARQRAREALDDTTSEVIDKLLSTRGSKLGPDQEAFLRKMLASYREFAAESGSTEEARASVARAQGRVGMILSRMGQPEDARASWQRAAELFDAMVTDYPDQIGYRISRNGFRHNVAVVDLEAGRLAEAEASLRANLVDERRMADEAPTDPKAGQELANTMVVLANLLRGSGRHEEAEAAFGSAEAILRRLIAGPSARPADRASMVKLLRNRALHRRNLGRIAGAEADFRESVAILEQAVAGAPEDGEHRADLVKAREKLAYFLSEIGKADEADAAFRKAIAEGKRIAADFPTVPAHRASLAEALGNDAIFLAGRGRNREAEAAFRDSLALRRQLAADFPTVPAYRDALASSLGNMGITHAIAGRRAEAEASYREEVAILRGLVAEVPGTVAYKNGLGQALYNQAIILEGGARREALREGIAVLRPIAAGSHGPLPIRLVLAASLAALGANLDHVRDAVEAQAMLREAMGLYDAMVTEAPRVLRYREELAVARTNLAGALQDAGRPAEAEPLYREAIAGFGRLVDEATGHPHYREELGETEQVLADLLADRGALAEATEWVDRATPRIESAMKANPDRPTYREALRRNRIIRAGIRARLGDRAAAVEIAELIARLGFDPAEDAYASARALTRCLPGAGPVDAPRVADQAMAALRRAVAAGLVDAGRIRDDKGLAPLRDRDDFRALWMDLAFPADPFARRD